MSGKFSLWLLVGFAIPFCAASLAGEEPHAHVAVVASPDFADALAPWIAYRQAQGYVIHRIDDLFPTGEASPAPVRPEAIRARLAELAASVPLEAILLIGDGAPTANDPNLWRRVVPAPRVPSRVIQNFGGEKSIASDGWYADLDNDGLPERAIGRLPVRTPEELSGVIRKIIRYETETSPGDWQRQIRLIAGMGGFSPIVDSVIDRSVRNMLSEMLPGGLDLSLTQANWRSPFCPDPEMFRYTVVDQINQGPLFWVYLGHGSHRGLDRLQIPLSSENPPEQNAPNNAQNNARNDAPDDSPRGVEYGIMEIEDVAYVDCRKAAPILLFCACYTGAYDAREDSLAERLAGSANGPIAVVAASRLSMPYGMAVFGVELMQEMFGAKPDRSQAVPTLGGFILAAKRRMIASVDEEESAKTDASFDSSASSPASDSPALSDSPPASEEARRDGVRRALDSQAKLFDPSAQELGGQLADHRHLFNLFGDPLLRVRLPESLTFDAPHEAVSGGRIPISDLSADDPPLRSVAWSPEPVSDGEFLVELALPPDRRAVKPPKREKFSATDSERLDFQETYEAANRRVIASVTVRESEMEGAIELPIPSGVTGRYVLRVTRHGGGRETAVGSREVTIRSARTSR